MGIYLYICKKVIGTNMKRCFAALEKRISASGNDSLLPGELEVQTQTRHFHVCYKISCCFCLVIQII